MSDILRRMLRGEYVDPMELQMQGRALDRPHRSLWEALSGKVRRGETMDNYLGRTLLDPNIAERGSILPIAKNRQGGVEFAAPHAALDLLKAALLPSHAMQGGSYGVDDVNNTALNATGGGLLSSKVAGGVPGGSLGMAAYQGPLRGKIAEHVGIFYDSPKEKNIFKRMKKEGAFPKDAVRTADFDETFSEIFNARKKRQSLKEEMAVANRSIKWRLMDYKRNLKRQKENIAFDNNIKSGLWRKDFGERVKAIGDPILIEFEAQKATLEGVPRVLKSQGWTVRHASKGRGGGRKNSRYLVSPDGGFEVRLSDHELPDNPARAYNHEAFGTRWDDEVIVTGRENPKDILDEILGLYQAHMEGR